MGPKKSRDLRGAVQISAATVENLGALRFGLELTEQGRGSENFVYVYESVCF